MAGSERGVAAPRMPAAAQRSRIAARIAIEAARIAGCALLGPVELLGRSVPGEDGQRLAERGIGRGEDRGGRRRRTRRGSRPIPTDCEPWPGKT